MSVIKPFRGIRYRLKDEAELADLIAPPYDVIDAKERDLLASRSPRNIVHLILGKEQKDDDDKNNKYTRAASLWREWLEDGVLAKDDSPALYRYNLTFTQKTPEGIVEKQRPGFVALLKLFEYSEGKVLPHERTLAGPKQDRFQLILNTRAQLSQVFMLYPDAKGAVDQALDAAPAEGALSCEDDLGVTHTIWPVTDKDAISAVQGHLENVPLYIADGHHRYETSLAIMKHLMKTAPLFAGNCGRIMAYFTPAEHEGLTVFPYHRLIHNLPKRRLSGLLKKLEELFLVERALVSPIEPGSPRRDFMAGLIERGKTGAAFGLVEGQSGRAFYLTLKEGIDLYRSCGSEAEVTLCGLDVVILEDLLLTAKLGMKPKDLLEGKYVSYQTDYDRILDAVLEPPNQLAIMVNPTPVESVLKVADRGGIMPEKSTYFYPKLATGLVMNSFD